MNNPSKFLKRMILHTFLLALSTAALSGPARAYTTENYTWGQVPIGGGGNIPNLVVHPKVADVVYLGADVGGVDRWDAVNLQWIPTLNYHGAPQGCDALAVDPSDTTGNVVWAAIGSSDGTPYSGVILKSTNRGATWMTSLSGVPNCSNGDQGWNNRLAVDPANGNVVYYAGRNGLWRTTDGGVTWVQLTSAPGGDQTKLGTGSGPSGDVNVTLDPTSGTVASPTRTKRVYLSPFGSALYKSEDGGTTWAVMSGAPANVTCTSVSTTGVLYCSARTVGTLAGGLYKYSGGASGTWTTITPFASNYYSSIQVDPFNQNNILAFANYQPLYSTDGGATWPYVGNQGVNQSVTATPSWYSVSSQSQFGWGGNALRYDPLHQGTVWESDAFMTWKTTNIYAATVQWNSYTAGHEETVGTAAMFSPATGAAFLYNGTADVYGFRHTSLTDWPTQTLVTRYGTDLELDGGDFEEANPNFTAFVGATGWNGTGDGGYTTDGGLTYQSFPNPGLDPNNQGGRIAISANSQTMVWGTGYPNQAVYYSTDLGATWTQSTGLPSAPADVGFSIFYFMSPLCSDRVNGSKFYVYHDSDGSFYRSTNGGVSFTQVATGLPGTINANLVANPTAEGDLWLSLQNIGLYHSTDSGSTWTKLANVNTSGMVGIGKGPTNSTASIYVIGEVDGATSQGVFRSDNLGVSWVKIDIFQPYPNGWVYMCGDRQTYGTVYFESSSGIYYGKRAVAGVQQEPTGVSATIGDSAVALTWFAPAGATSYNVKRSTVSGSGYATITSTALTNYTNNGLTNNTTYYFVITAVSSLGESINSSQIAARPHGALPATPTGLIATPGNAQIALTWNSVVGATSYNVMRSTTCGTGYATVAAPATTSYTNTGLVNGTAYYYVVEGVNAGGTSGNSIQACAMPSATALVPVGNGSFETPNVGTATWAYNPSAAPWTFTGQGGIQSNGSGFSAPDAPDGVQTAFLQGDGGVLGSMSQAVNFTATGTYVVRFIAAYRAYEGVQPIAISVDGVQVGSPISPAGTTFAACTSSSFTISTTGSHTIALAATINTGDETSFIDQVTIAGVLAPPAAPTGLTATAGNAQVTLSWTASSGATSYNVKRSTVNGSGYAQAANVATTSYTNTGLTNGTTYYFVVTAVNSSGESGNSNQASATPIVAFVAPTGLTATLGNAQIALTWTASTGATSYNLKRSTVTGSGYATISSPTVTSYTNTGLANGTPYYYVVSAVNSTGETPNSIQACATPSAAAQVAVANNSFETPWVGNGGSWYNTPNATWTFVGSSGIQSNGSGFTAPTAPDGNQTAFLQGSGGTLGSMSVPVNFTATGSYVITFLGAYRAYGGVNPIAVSVDGVQVGGAISPASSTTFSLYTTSSFTISTTGNHTIAFAVTDNTADKTSFVDQVTIAKVVAPPLAPTGLTATAGNAQVALSWTASSGATAYDVKRSTVSGSGYVTVSSPTVTNYTNTGLTNGTAYYFVVDAKNAGGTSANSAQASATPIAPPTGLAGVSTDAQIALTWNASTGATSYNVYRGTSAGGESGTAIATGIAVTNYTNTALTDGVNYFYTVKAVNATGTSGASNETSGIPAQYNFESGVQGWSFYNAPATGVAQSATQAFGITHSLAVMINGAAGAGYAYVNSPTATAGKVITAHVWIPAGSQLTAIQLYIQDQAWAWSGNAVPIANLTAGAWNTVTFTVPSGAGMPLQRLGVQFQTGATWSGTCYVDSVSW